MVRWNKTNIRSDKGILWYKPNLNPRKKAEFDYIKYVYEKKGNATTPHVAYYGKSGMNKIKFKKFKTKASALDFIAKYKRNFRK